MTKNIILKLLVATTLFVTNANYAQNLLPREYLQRQTKPVFRPGSTLPPLMTNGFGDATYGQPGEPILSFNNVKELAENWGYAFQIPSSATQSTNITQAKSIVDNTSSDANKIISLVQSNPAKYKMYGMIDLNTKFGRIPLSPIECPDCFARDANNNFIAQDGSIILASTVTAQFLTTNHQPFVMNPFISDANLLRCSQKLGTMFDYIKQKAPITIAMDYGEAGVYIPYYAQRTWKKIPQAPTDLTSEIAGWNWLSDKWNRIMKGLWQDIPRNLTSDGFVYYYTNDAGLSNGRFGNGFGVSRDGWKGYNYNYDITKDQNKYTMGQTYFGQFNTGWGLAAINSQATSNSPGFRDAFTTHMNTRALEIPMGKPYSIHWLASGWGDNIVSENDRWTGALKCFYTTGVLGANVGLYAQPTATIADLARLYPTTFSESTLPDYINQWISHSRVHAIYSWIEPFTMNSDLMEGQKIRDWGREERYYYAGGFDRAKPSYEFWAYPIGTAVPTPVANPVDNFINNAAVADQGARIVARKLRNSNKYILTAWAMNGENREVEVYLTGVGKIKVNARKAGTIYHIDNTSGTPVYTILDNDGMGIVTDQVAMKKALCYLYNDDCQSACSLPLGWTFSSIGGIAGQSTCEGNGTFTIKSGGTDIWGTSDQFNYTYKKLKGDGTIIAKVDGFYGGSGNYAKTGVMIRETLDPGSAHADCLFVRGNEVNFQFRQTVNAITTRASLSGIIAPRWVKLQRAGNVFTAYHSANGNTWTQISNPTTVNMGADVYIGLAATSRNGVGIGTSTISNVNISSDSCTLPSGMTFANVGGLTGQSTCEENGTFTLKAGGDIWNTSDKFNYTYETLNGDGTIIAKVNYLQNTNNAARSGVMIRETLDTGSVHADCLINCDNISTFQVRPTTNAVTTHSYNASIRGHNWLKLQRVGNVFKAYKSIDGNNWTPIGNPTTINMRANVYIGLASTSRNPNAIGTSSISNVRITKVNSSTNRDTALGIKDITSSLSSSALSVFPNPNDGNFSVNFNSLEKDNYTIEVANLLGQSVYKENLSNFSGNANKQLSLPNREKGVYIITLTNSNGNKISKKLVVN